MSWHRQSLAELYVTSRLSRIPVVITSSNPANPDLIWVKLATTVRLRSFFFTSDSVPISRKNKILAGQMRKTLSRGVATIFRQDSSTLLTLIALTRSSQSWRYGGLSISSPRQASNTRKATHNFCAARADNCSFWPRIPWVYCENGPSYCWICWMRDESIALIDFRCWSKSSQKKISTVFFVRVPPLLSAPELREQIFHCQRSPECRG